MPKTQSFISRMPENIFGYHGWPSVCKTDDNTLLAICSGYRMAHVCPFGKSVLFASRDEGKTWSPPVIVNDTPLDDRDTGILNMGNGRLLVTWFVHPADVYLNRYLVDIINARITPWEKGIILAHMAAYQMLEGEQREGGSFIRISEDNGMTWGETIRVPVSSPHGPTMLADGTVLYLGKEMYAKPGEEQPGAVAAYASSDGGYTWTRRGEVPVPEHLDSSILHEPHAIQLPNGRIFGTIRISGKAPQTGKDYFTVCSTISDDGGQTWSMPQETGMEGSPPHLFLHSSGVLICAVGRRKAPFGQRAYISSDGGETWEREIVLCDNGPDGDLGYPATVELSDGRMLTVYYQKPESGAKAALMQTIWSL